MPVGWRARRCALLTALFPLIVGCGDSNSPAAVEFNPANRFAYKSVRRGNQEIYAVTVEGLNELNVTDHPSQDSSPTWSPDGSKIAFVSD